MRNTLKQQLIATALLSIIAGILYYGLSFLYPGISHPVFYALLGWFFFQDLALGVMLRNAAKSDDPQKFVFMFQVSFGIKFIFALVILLMLVLKFPLHKRLFAFLFMGLYIFFMIADTILLIRLINRKKQS